ncbi:MAG: tetratricopeptide repeat protein [Bryobacterales bacterium]|nr:tetratricopeptide repeat protein [Bryobacterales bacterium]
MKTASRSSIPRQQSPQPSGVREQLEKILRWEPFARAGRLSRFLRFAVEQVLENPVPVLKEYVIAVEVFDKPKDFDPRLDPIVRVEARRLRARLREYYESEGKNDEVLIVFGRSGYTPAFTLRNLKAVDPPPIFKHDARPPARMPRFNEPVVLAVLPFLDLSPSGDQHNLCAGFAEELINAISRFPGLRVTSRTSTRQYEGRAFDLRLLGADLGVDCVLEGSLRKDGNRIRLSVQLYSVSDGLEIWSRTYERQLTDVFAAQEEVASAIARDLRTRLVRDEQPGAMRAQTNLRAYRTYLQGLQHLRRGGAAGQDKAISLFERAILQDPDFPAPHAGLANAYAFLAWFREMSPSEAWPKAELSAQRALLLDPSRSGVRAIVGCARALFQWKWDEAESEFREAVDRNPADPLPRQWYACAFLAPRRRLDEALAEMHQAQALQPLSPAIQCHTGLIHFYRGEYEEAGELCRGALEIEPGFWPAHWVLGRASLAGDDPAAALDSFAIAAQGCGSLMAMSGYLGYCYARLGDTERAARLAEDIRLMSRSTYVSPLHAARIFLGLGQTAQALEMLESACSLKCVRLTEVLLDPLYQCLRWEARFDNIVQTIGLPAAEWEPQRAAG